MRSRSTFCLRPKVTILWMIFWRWLSCFKCMQNSTEKKSIENASSDSLITMQSIWFQGPRFSTELNWTGTHLICFYEENATFVLTSDCRFGQWPTTWKKTHISITKFVLIVLSLEKHTNFHAFQIILWTIISMMTDLHFHIRSSITFSHDFASPKKIERK